MNMNPAEALKNIQKELQEKFDEAGMGKVEEFTDLMDDLMDKLKSGPDAAMDAVKGKFNEMTGKIEAAMKDPASLAPSGGGLAACGAWYGNAVVGKLMLIKDELDQFIGSLGKLAADVKKPMMEMADGLKSAIEELEKSVKGLAKLPKLVAQELQGKDSPDDIAKINTDAMKKALQVGDIDGALAKITGMRSVLEQVIATLCGGAQPMQDFITGAPDKIRTAFDVPQPLCFLTSMVMDSAPQAFKDLMEICKKLESVSLDPLIQVFNNSKGTVEGINVDAIKTPVNKFVESAKDLVDKLDKTVQGAKASGGAGKALGALGKMF